MNVTTRNTGELNAILKVEISPEDYSEKVDKVLNDYRRRASIPGFRPGKVPASLIKKQYGKAVLIDEVNHILQHAVYDHIKDEKLDILGNPLPVPQNDIDWDNQREFAFEFELGLTPDIELNFNNKTKVPYYKIVADKKMVDNYVEDYAKRFGSMTFPEKIEEKSIVKAHFSEKNSEDGIEKEASFNIDNIKDKKSLKELLGKKVGDKLSLNVKKAFDKDFKLAGILGEKIEASAGDFELSILEISLLNPAPLNQELFDKVFGEGAVKSEEEFIGRIKEDAEKMFRGESERKFYEDVKDTILSKTKVELPDAFLKRWMQTSGDNPISEEEAEKQYNEMQDTMKWQLIENKVAREHNIEVSQQELTDYTKDLISKQMAQYGQMPQEIDLDSIAARVMENKDEAQRITDQLFSEKLIHFFKENLKLVEKEVSFDEFLKEVQK